jgi:hypothetical protein
VAIALDRGFPDSSPDDGLPRQASTRQNSTGQNSTGQNNARQLSVRQITATRLGSRSARNWASPSDLAEAYTRPGLARGESLLPTVFARTESSPSEPTAPERPVTADDLEPRLVKESFARLMSEGPAAMEYFYARLFAASPDTRALFPMSMTAQRERMFTALTQISGVWIISPDAPPWWPGSVAIIAGSA